MRMYRAPLASNTNSPAASPCKATTPTPSLLEKRKRGASRTPIALNKYDILAPNRCVANLTLSKTEPTHRSKPDTYRPIRPALKANAAVSPSAVSDNSSDASQFPYLTPFATKLHPEPPKTTLSADLELMHQFTAITWKTLPRSASLSQIWQVTVPRLALDYDFLMHSILAIAAFHLTAVHAEKHQHQSYWVRATYHQNEAMRLFRQQTVNINDENCHAIFMTASLLILSVFASSSARVAAPSHSSSSLDNLLAVFHLIRGMNGILNAYEGVIHKGLLGEMMQLSRRNRGTALLRTIERELRTPELPLDVGLEEMHTYKEGVDVLLEWVVHARTWADEAESRICTTWPSSLSAHFMERLACRDPAALKVLLIYCRILESAGCDYWYMEGWGAGVTRDITIQLGGVNGQSPVIL